MKIAWSEEALADTKTIEEYFGQYNLRAAVAAGDRTIEQVSLQETFPKRRHEGKLFGNREIAVRGSNCVVVYGRVQ